MAPLLPKRKYKLRAGWLVFFLALVLTGWLGGILQGKSTSLSAVTGDDILSLELAFSPSRAEKMVVGWEQAPPIAHQSETVAVVELAWQSVHYDFLFILAYLALMWTTSELVLRAEHPPPPKWTRPWLRRLPFLVALLDVLENVLLYLVLAGIPELAPVVGFLAVAKFVSLFWFAVAVLLARRTGPQVL